MGYYFNPPALLELSARKLTGVTYDQLVAQLQGDEILMGVYDNGRFKAAPHLFSPQEFLEFEVQARAGILKRVGFYALDVKKHAAYEQMFPKPQAGKVAQIPG